MQLLYPHPIDRYRIIQKLVRMKRETVRLPGGEEGLDQISLSRRAKVSQSIVSTIENMEASINPLHRRVSREYLLKVLTWGLNFSQDDLDTILWLYDGETLQEDEIRRYVRGYLPGALPRRYTGKDFLNLRTNALALLSHTRDLLFKNERRRLAEVRIFSQAQKVEAETALLTMERQPGVQFLVTEYPEYVILPHDLIRAREERQPVSREIQEKLITIQSEREETFRANLRDYGRRDIFCKSSLERSLRQPRTTDSLGLVALKKQIEHCIELLESYPHFEIGLALSTPALELDIKSTKQVMLQGAGSYNNDREMQLSWGPYYVQWLDEASVLTFFLDFEKAWGEIPPEDRMKENVIPWLRKLITS